MKAKLKNQIIRALRKITYMYEPRNTAKKRAKVGPALYQCEHCSIVVYEGSRELSDLDLSEFKDSMKGKVYLDHKEPVIDPQRGWRGWDEYIVRMFCDAEGYQVLCKECHTKKTKEEDEIRKKSKKKVDK